MESHQTQHYGIEFRQFPPQRKPARNFHRPIPHSNPAQTKQEWESGGNEGGIPSIARNDGILLSPACPKHEGRTPKEKHPFHSKKNFTPAKTEMQRVFFFRD